MPRILLGIGYRLSAIPVQKCNLLRHFGGQEVRNSVVSLLAPASWLSLSLVLSAFLSVAARAAEPTDVLLDLFVKKGFVTEEEAKRVKAEAEALRASAATNPPPELAESKWKFSDAFKSVEFYGDFRLRYEYRRADAPGGWLQLDRERVAVRLGLRGDLLDDFYWGIRFDTASNPRSPWVSLGTSSSGAPYYGPFGKSTFTVNIGQAFLGWRPTDWADFTIGKFANPLFTTPMLWDPDLNPEGAVERFKYSVGPADFFATFGQFLYADFNPDSASGGLGVNGLVGQEGQTVLQLAWQGGLAYHFSSNLTAKVAATLYHYVGLQTNTPSAFGDPYVGEGAYLGPGSGTVNGASGFVTGSAGNAPGFFNGYPNNQSGLNHLLVIDVPFELNYKLSKFLNLRLFGDVAYNLEGDKRAEEAATAYAAYLANNSASIAGFAPQRNDRLAYQAGIGIGNTGLVTGSTSRRHTWELRSYWQHVEQYALDPNLIDSDFFEGRLNLEGVYVAGAYSFSDNILGTIRYGHANRINQKLGTGGDNLDIPQVNPIQKYNILQVDVTLRF